MYFVLIAIFLLALLVTYVLTPAVIKISLEKGFVDRPNERKVHKEPIPYGGGIATFIGFLVASCVGMAIWKHYNPEISSRDLMLFCGFLVAAFLSFVTGFIDDIINMPAKVKLLCQIFTVSIVMFFGILVNFFTNPFGEGLIYLPIYIAVPVTIFWIVGITNAVNLLDGLDGLLGGITVISAIIFLFVSIMKGQLLVAGIMVALAGSALGFLKYNFHPAKIFMGDTGSLFIGSIFAIASVVGGLKTTTTVAMVIPFLIMGLPIFDTAWAIVRRASNHQPIFKPDKGHIHHRLLALGLTQVQAVLIIYSINILLGLIALSVCYFTLR
ncbi:undecaprenyl/decaprenyl-phosphate alpha-N-acetylglucosaminyl 1-phosphate transferase [bacterium]|nr:undecaprenyl/decaprenyl-phosphate alpha-N-acetylglucosaminyl 1-phosphate transferase [bacterium]